MSRAPRERSVQAAEPSDAPAELRESLVQLFAPEVGPAYRCRIVLRVRRLPQQEVAEAHLATRTNDQIQVGQPGRVQVPIDDVFGNVRGGDALREQPSHGPGDLL